ncbi:MAG: glycosyltransferase family 1 protein [bacterium]|nr:glycosyltransferase family 1 protein [bacterium]
MNRRIQTRIPTLHVSDIELPREVEQLYELAYNLWWSWTPHARELFSSIDSAKWALYRNPVELLINVDPKRWYHLLDNEAFRARYQAVIRDFEDYLGEIDQTWFSSRHGEARGEAIAYFSMEYGLHQSLAVYSGGLGVLSGDHCKASSDLGLPMIAVGLLYRQGYFRQTLDADGQQQHNYPEYDFTRLPLRPIASATGHEVTISVRLPGRDVLAKLWLAQVGRVPLVLLDTDVPENDPADRPISSQLYVNGREMRLLQEILLGIGGVKALRAIGVSPTVWHINEGHSVFLQLERLRELVAGDLALGTAMERIRRDTVFTTHTPVEAGNERFEPELIGKYFTSWCGEAGMALPELLDLGRARDGDHQFNLTALAIRTTSSTNGVSKLNAEVASRMWSHLFPAPGDGDLPIRAVTNGVHAGTWLGNETQKLLGLHLGPQWESMLLAPEVWEKVLEIPDADLWTTHRAQKERLGRFTRSRLREQRARHGAAPDELRSIGALFDPRALTIGFARRFATYKRAKLVFSDEERLRRLLTNEDRPVQMLFAGKAHPADRPGQGLIQHIFELSREHGFAGRVFFLENYDIRMGRMLVQGVDLWLNTPRRPLEASGTSGQKVAMNGGLNFSISDGWWPEGFDGNNGWVIGSDHPLEDENQQDAEDAASLYDLLENTIIPLYYQRDDDDLPRRWIGMMKQSMACLTPKFSASRMVRDYTETAYLPAAARRSAGS